MMGEKKRRQWAQVRTGTFRHVPTACLNCGKPLDASSWFGTDGEVPRPDEGDVTVCLYCRHLMVYNADLSLRNPTDKEIVELAGDPKLVATIDLLGAYGKEQEIEERRRDGRPQAGDDEARRQIHRTARRAALAYLQATSRKAAGSQ